LKLIFKNRLLLKNITLAVSLLESSANNTKVETINIPNMKFLISSWFFSEKMFKCLKYVRVIGVKNVNVKENDIISGKIE
jgi:hypothetical protein